VGVGDGGPLLDGFAALHGDVRARPGGPDYARLSRLWQEAFRAVAFEHADPDAVLVAAAQRWRAERSAEAP